MLTPTALTDQTKAAGATYQDDAGHSLPAHFGDAQAEYAAALSGAALFDGSHAGKVEVRGPEAPDFLHNLSTNDVKGLPLGGGCEAFFCNVRARVLFHGRIYRVRLDGADALWVDVTPGRGAALMQHLDRHLIAEQVELKDQSADFALMHLAGPGAANVLSRAIGEPVPDLGLLQHMERTVGSRAVANIRRHDPLGVPGYDVVCTNARAGDVWDGLVAAGARPAGQIAHERLRVEAGTPIYGRDMDDNRFVVEVSRPQAISFTKGCYLGQEPIVMARDRAGFVSRTLKGLRLSSGGVTPGAKLFTDGEAGWLTSLVETPDGGAALGYLRRGFEADGTVLKVGADGMITATVSPFPLRG